MNSRKFGVFDRLLGEIDKAIKVLTVALPPSRPLPATLVANDLPETDRKRSARLMRVNHAGEIGAQGLYQGQALTARDPAVRAAMRRAAAEEMDHLAWCRQRISELNGRTSVLNPFWYAGSMAIGALAGAIGDGTSLGFVAETERQVESHLTDHLQRLSAADSRSRAILEQMQHDEIQHGENAASLGAEPLSSPIRFGMRATSKLMTYGSYWI